MCQERFRVDRLVEVPKIGEHLTFQLPLQVSLLFVCEPGGCCHLEPLAFQMEREPLLRREKPIFHRNSRIRMGQCKDLCTSAVLPLRVACVHEKPRPRKEVKHHFGVTRRRGMARFREEKETGTTRGLVRMDGSWQAAAGRRLATRPLALAARIVSAVVGRS